MLSYNQRSIRRGRGSQMKVDELLKEAVDIFKKLPPEKQLEAVGVVKGILISEIANTQLKGGEDIAQTSHIQSG